VLTLLVLLTALPRPRRLLLLLLTGLLLSAALLSALLLTTLLLLTGLLVWILIHRTFLSNFGLKYHRDRLHPHGQRQCVAVALVPVHAPAQL